jgi:hypothetical protein
MIKAPPTATISLTSSELAVLFLGLDMEVGALKKDIASGEPGLDKKLENTIKLRNKISSGLTSCMEKIND